MSDDEKPADDAATDTLPDGRAIDADDRPHADSPNPTQERLESESGDKPVDVGWEGDAPDA